MEEKVHTMQQDNKTWIFLYSLRHGVVSLNIMELTLNVLPFSNIVEPWNHIYELQLEKNKRKTKRINDGAKKD